MASPVTFTVKGADVVSARLTQLARRFPMAAAVALNEIAEEIMTDAKEHTPVETGRLRASGKVSDMATPGKMEVRLTYGTEYAVHVHENLAARHPVGEAKFLERAIDRRAGTLARDLAAKLGEVLA